MSRWVLRGLKSGRLSSPYPVGKDTDRGISPGIISAKWKEGIPEELSSICPTGAISFSGEAPFVDRRRCIHCMRCRVKDENNIFWDRGIEWARWVKGRKPLPLSFRHSVHIRVVDVGDCGACLNEVKLLNNPYYNMHRSGFFITPTPREADVLLVVGRLTEHMKAPLVKVYEAMPSPKRVIAVGACALEGGIFKRDMITPHEVSMLIPVDIEVPGCPPPPLSIYHSLLLVSGQMDEDFEKI